MHKILNEKDLQIGWGGTNSDLSSAMELTEPLPLLVPGRWTVGKLNYGQAVSELDRLAGILAHGVDQLHGLYMRMCDLIRDNNLSDDDVRLALCKHFSPPRVSEFLRVAHAPDAVYRRYHGGFVGFKAALRECRGYRVTPNEQLRRRKIQHAAQRLARLAGATTVCVSRWEVAVREIARP
jgi:hypothetical protein